MPDLEQALDELEEIVKVITRDVMVQYEEICSLGPCNMFDYNCVMCNATDMGFHALGSLTKDEYSLILRHFSALMKYHGVEQEGRINEGETR